MTVEIRNNLKFIKIFEICLELIGWNTEIKRLITNIRTKNMNSLLSHLENVNISLYNKFLETSEAVTLLLDKYSANFPTYTDHSINHTREVLNIASELLTDDEISQLNADEVYILSMSCLLHDIGMCIPESKIKEISDSEEIVKYRQSHPNQLAEDYLRDVHHLLSHKFIINEWELLKIPTLKYAKAIGLVSEGHRKVDIGNFEIYDPNFFAKNGKEFVCLPFLACVLRIADELDVTNSRTPKLLTKYYMPNNDVSIREWNKHLHTLQRNYFKNKVIFEVDCSEQKIYAALQDQFEKIQNVINYCQKVLRSIPHSTASIRTLNLNLVEVKYNFKNFDPKGIKFSLDVQNVVTAFIGEDLYRDRLTSVREALQNSVDSCRYKRVSATEYYKPKIEIFVGKDYIKIEDNASGMDEFIIENYFGRLASSFYEQEKVKSTFEAIGQFGVGVFSYFLLSEYVDIETKTITTPALKFRFDKDPKSYFHFYDKTDRVEPGTTITMHFKDELVDTISFSDIENYVKKVFNHIEIPIHIKSNEAESCIDPLPFVLNASSEIDGRLKLQERKSSKNLYLEEIYIDDDIFEGKCGIILGKNYLDTFSYTTSIFEFESFRPSTGRQSYSQISFSQKGVYVNKYSSPRLDMLVGDINLKKKVKININRNDFYEFQDIDHIIQRFEIRLLEKVFSYLEKKCCDDYERIDISEDFVGNYLNGGTATLTSEYKDLLKKYIRIRGTDPEHLIYTLGDLDENFENILLISDQETIPNFDSGVIVVANDTGFFGAFNRLGRIIKSILRVKEHVLIIDGRFYQLFSKQDIHPDTKKAFEILDKWTPFIFIKLTYIKSKYLLFNLWYNKDEADVSDYYPNEDCYYNVNHSFFKYIIKFEKEIEQSPEFRQIIKSVFSYFRELLNDEFNAKSIQKLNDMMAPLNAIYKVPKFRLSDFQQLND